MIGGWLGWGYKGPVPKPTARPNTARGIKRPERQAMAFLHHAPTDLITVAVLMDLVFPEKSTGHIFRQTYPEPHNLPWQLTNKWLVSLSRLKKLLHFGSRCICRLRIRSLGARQSLRCGDGNHAAQGRRVR